MIDDELDDPLPLPWALLDRRGMGAATCPRCFAWLPWPSWGEPSQRIYVLTCSCGAQAMADRYGVASSPT